MSPEDPARAMSPPQVPAHPVATRAQVARDHRGYSVRFPVRLQLTALRTKSVHSREVLSDYAWPWHTPAEVDAWADSGDPWPVALPEMDLNWMGRYAEVLAVQTGRPEERARARRMLEGALAADTSGRVRTLSVELLLQLRLAERDEAGAAELVDHRAIRPPIAAGVRTDLANPWIFPGRDPARWLEQLNRTLHSSEVADLGLADTAAIGESPVPPLDRLVVRGLSEVPAPYRVTVLMSTHRPGPHLRTAVRSVIEQTWPNLELLLVDDASGPSYEALLREVAGSDPRIQLIRKAVNGGTYRARNTALRRAAGDFVTVVDSDDYLHPQALELGLRRLLADASLMGVRSEAVRVSEVMELNRPGYLPRVTFAPSLLFRLPQVTGRIGFFDPTSKGADTEYFLRIQAAFGKDSLLDIPEVLSLARAGETLSSTEFSRGWRHPARHAYKSAYGPWHDRIRAGLEDPFLDPEEPRRFPEPRRWTKPLAPDLGRPARFDLCVAGDWRQFGGPQKSMLEEIAAARDAGLRVAVMHLEALRNMEEKDLPLCEAVTDLVNTGQVERLHHDDDVDLDILLVRYPPILQYPPTIPTVGAGAGTPVRARRVLLVANQSPVQPDGSEQRYVVRDVTDRTLELFGRAPVWVPQSPRIRQILLQQDPDVTLADWDNPGLIDVARSRVRPRRAPGEGGAEVVVGRYSRPNPMKFPPTWAEMLRGYDFAQGYQVRMMGGRYPVGELLRAEDRAEDEVPDNWELTREGVMPVREFLAALDFFLYLDDPAKDEAFGRVLLEAAASGVLTIAHPRHALTFGDVLDYAAPGEAQELVAGYVADPDRYADRVERTLALVADRFGHQGFVARLAAEGVRVPAPAGADQDTDPRATSPLHLLVDAPGDGVLPLRVGVAGDLVVRSVPLRSAADAERVDQLSVVHRPGAEGPVRDWLAAVLEAHPGRTLEPALLDSLPQAVTAMLVCRDGLVRLVSRGPVSGIPATENRLDPGDPPPPPGWSLAAWWARQPSGAAVS